MKENLYRGKQEQSGEWVYGNLVQYINVNEDNNENYILTQEEVHHTLDLGGRIECDMEPVASETVGQFIGITDIDHNEIFEGDVLSFIDELGYSKYDQVKRVGVVDFSDGSFVIKDKNEVKHYRWIDYNFHKLGNIYDNPELMKD